MDRPTIHGWLSTGAYWALGRPREQHDRAMDGSLNFGMFHAESGRQVAYARVVTDRATFAWLCDVFVDESVRGDGVGIALIAGVTERLEGLGLRRTMLATRDAHGLYAKFGFAPIQDAEKWMVRQAG
jgi:GNAT superfamily N-acetyltransferase